MSDELQQSQIETVIAAFGSIRQAYDAGATPQEIVDSINAIEVGNPPENLAIRELGRPIEQDDIVEARRRRQMRVLFEDIETLCRTAVSGGFTLAQLKTQIISRCS